MVLDSKDKELIVEYFKQGYSMNKISKMVGTSVTTVKNVLVSLGYRRSRDDAYRRRAFDNYVKALQDYENNKPISVRVFANHIAPFMENCLENYEVNEEKAREHLKRFYKLTDADSERIEYVIKVMKVYAKNYWALKIAPY